MEKIDPKEIERNLNQFTGTENYYKYLNLNLSDGVKYLCDTCQCYWLVDLILSYQSKAKKDEMLRYMQFWTLKAKDNIGVAICERDTDDIAFKQIIPFTDFPLDSIKLYLQNDVLFLPSEY